MFPVSYYHDVDMNDVRNVFFNIKVIVNTIAMVLNQSQLSVSL